MSTTWVTRCPQCATAFRLNHQQLTVAAGSVRCGSCLKVFKAQDNLVNPDTPLPEELQPKRPAPSVATPTQEQSAQKAALEKPAPAKKSTQSDLELSDAFQSLQAPSERDHFAEDNARQPLEPRSGADESWAEEMLQELENEPEQTPQTKPTVAPKPQPKPEQKTAQPEESEQAQQKAHQQQWLHDLAPDPIGIQEEGNAKITRTRIAWAILSVLAALVLVGQYAYYNFDTLARTAQWRPSYTKVCALLNCQLPGIQDLSKIHSGNLVIRSHERFENALIVDAVVYNQAAHQQPFPNIELLFTDLEGAPVASRIFTPSEYLGGELAGAKLMPSATPIHLSLTIQDPGSSALNYQLSFYPPKLN